MAGDVILGWNLARTLVDSGIAWNATDRTEMYAQPGGAALMAHLMTEVSATPSSEGTATTVSGPSLPAETVGDPHLRNSYAIWSRFPRKKGDRDGNIWRVEKFLGLDQARKPESVPAAQDSTADPGICVQACCAVPLDRSLFVYGDSKGGVDVLRLLEALA